LAEHAVRMAVTGNVIKSLDNLPFGKTGERTGSIKLGFNIESYSNRRWFDMTEFG
jgi:hypothetical protein